MHIFWTEEYTIWAVSLIFTLHPCKCPKPVTKFCFYFSYEDRSFNRFIIQSGLFNLTATFRTDSDFPIPYMQTKRRHSPCDACLPTSTILKQKTKFLGWIVSHCSTPSKRERYFAELSKYVPSDKFGQCGKDEQILPQE